MITGNKGEWSEIYTFLKLLGEGGIFGADGNLNKIPDKYYPLIEVVRNETQQTPKRYSRNDADNTIKIIDGSTNECLLCTDTTKFLQQAQFLLNAIKTNTGAFTVTETEKFMKEVYCNCLKAPAKDKSDIVLILHDKDTGTDNTLGFSIKSQLGNPATLVNPSRETVFVYEICGGISKEEIEQINAINTKSKIIDRINRLLESGYTINFIKTGDIFQLNLQMLSDFLPLILAQLLLFSYKKFDGKCVKNLNKLADIIEKDNPCNYDLSKGHKLYQYKIQDFLVAYALGMKAKTVWNGKVDATGGYIVVKKDGDIVCYHFYKRNEFAEYMLNNTKMETPNNRADFGKIYTENGKAYIKLNLQIRFV